MFPMGMVSNRMTAAQWRTKLFTSSTTFIVPNDIGCIWVDGCGGGGGGGGGNSTPGGGGGGGSGAIPMRYTPFPTTPGEVLTITIGAAGTGGVADADGVNGGNTSISGAAGILVSGGALRGRKGEAAAGGVGGGLPNASGGAGTGVSTWATTSATTALILTVGNGTASCGAGGNAASGAGGYAYLPNGVTTMDKSAAYIYGGGTGNGAAGNASGGGGGTGGSNTFGAGGMGGANGGAGSNATGYGAGGGGGSGNTAGGNGSPGFIRLYCLTAYAI